MTESRQTPQQIAEGYLVEHHPTDAMRVAYAARVAPDDSPRPRWRFWEHQHGGPMADKRLSRLVSDGLRKWQEAEARRRKGKRDLDHHDAWRH